MIVVWKMEMFICMSIREGVFGGVRLRATG